MSEEAERFTFTQWLPPWVRHQHLTRYAWAQQFVEGLRVADVACGEGYGSDMLSRQGGAASVDGFDLSPAAIKNASEKYGTEGKARFHVADVTKLPAGAESFDVCVSFETIEHIPDDAAFVSEVARILSPRGKFICSTPNRDLFDPGTTLNDKPVNPFHVREYDLAEFDRLLRAKFREIAWYGQTFYFTGYRRMLCSLGRRLPKAALLAHRVSRLPTLPWEGRERHVPKPLTAGSDPEIYIAVCTK